MLKEFKRISSTVFKKINKIFSDPIKYARSIGVTLGDGCSLLGRTDWGSEPYLIKIGNNVRITSGCSFVTHDGGMHVLRNSTELTKADLFGPIVIGNNVFIGIKSIIMPGVTIGNNVVIGAGSIITKDIPDNSIVCGVPARVIKSIDEYYIKAKEYSVPTKGLNAKEKKEFLYDKYYN